MTNITKRDEATGVLETGDFDKENLLGFRVRVAYIQERSLITLKLKGGGPYYVDLGVDQGMEELSSGVKACI